MADLRTLGSVIYTAVRPLLPTAWVAHWDAGGNRLRNLGEPDHVFDAARKNEVDIVGFAAEDATEAAAAATTAAENAQITATNAQTTANAAASDATTALSAATAAASSATSAQESAEDAAVDAATALAAAEGAAPQTRAITAGNGLTGGGTLEADRSFAVDFGTGATQVRPANDNAYTNARTPTAHAESHEDGGSDELDVTGLAGVLAQPQRAGSIAASGGDLAVGAIADGQALIRAGTSVLSAAIPVASDGTPTTITGPGTPSNPGGSPDLARADHSHSHGSQGGGVAHTLASTGTHGFMSHQESTKLSGIEPGANAVAAGTGITSTGTGAITLAADFGTTSGKVTEGNDSRLTNARTPTAHAASHENGGSDELSLHASQITAGTFTPARVTSAAEGEYVRLVGGVLVGDTPAGGGGTGDIESVTAGTGLSGGGTTGDITLNVVYGTGSGTAAQGNDARLSDSRTPTAHAASHEAGGADEIDVTSLSGILADPQVADTLAATGGNLTVGAITDGQMLVRSGSTIVSAAVPTGDITAVVAGTGLTGGATTGSATLDVVFGATAGTAAEGNDSRIVAAVPNTRTITAGTGLSGGGDLSANRTLTVSYGTSGTTAAAGNDARLSDDRTASGLRSATTVVAVSTATAPSANQILKATSSTAAGWSSVAVSEVSGFGSNVATFLATPSSANLASMLTDETGTGANVHAVSPALTTPNLGTPSAATLTNATGLPISTGVSGLGTGVATFLATPSSANLASALTDETGTGAAVFATSPTLVTPVLGTPASGTLTNCTGLPVGAVTGLGTDVGTFLATPSSANLRAALTDETGTGAAVFATSPTLVTPNLGTPSALTLTNATGLPAAGVSSGTFALARMTPATAGQPLRVNVAGTAIEGAFPPMAFTTTNAVTTTPTVLITLTLPWAGEYLVESRIFPTQTVSGTRITTVQFDVTNVTAVELTTFRGTGAAFTTQEITASGQSVSQSLNQNQRGLLDTNGRVVVSAPATFTLTVSQDTGSATLSGGSYARATRVS